MKRRPLVPQSLVDLYRQAKNALRRPLSLEERCVAELAELASLHHQTSLALQAAADRTRVSKTRRMLLKQWQTHERLAEMVSELAQECGGAVPRLSERWPLIPHEALDMFYARDEAELRSFIDDDLLRVARRYDAARDSVPPHVAARLRDFEASFTTSLGNSERLQGALQQAYPTTVPPRLDIEP